MPKNPFTGEEMSQDVFDFIINNNEQYKSCVDKLNAAYDDKSLGIWKKRVKKISYNPTAAELQENERTFDEFNKDVSTLLKEVSYYGACHDAFENERQAREEYEDAKYKYEKDEEYEKLANECKKLQISEVLLDKCVKTFFEMPQLHKAVVKSANKDSDLELGGPNGIISSCAGPAIYQACGNEMVNEKREKAITKVLEHMCKDRFQSPDLKKAGEGYFKAFVKEAAAEQNWKEAKETLDNNEAYNGPSIREKRARKAYEEIKYKGFEKDEEYENLKHACEAVGVSDELLESSIETFFEMPQLYKAVAKSANKDSGEELGGPNGIISQFAWPAILKADGDAGEEKLNAITKVLEHMSKSRFQSPDLKKAGEGYFKEVEAEQKWKEAKEELDKSLTVPKREPIDKEAYDLYVNVIEQREKMNIYFAQAKEAFMFPKKETLSVEGRNAALDKYAEARDRADSHWGITKFFASLMPGIFKETAKDMADEKMWRETLKGANFTNKELDTAHQLGADVDGNEVIDIDFEVDTEMARQKAAKVRKFENQIIKEEKERDAWVKEQNEARKKEYAAEEKERKQREIEEQRVWLQKYQEKQKQKEQGNKEANVQEKQNQNEIGDQIFQDLHKADKQPAVKQQVVGNELAKGEIQKENKVKKEIPAKSK